MTIAIILILSHTGIAISAYLLGSKYPVRSAADSLLRSVDELIKKKK